MKKKIAIIVALILGLIIFLMTSYTVKENHAAVVFRYGKIKTIETDAGIHFHAPIIESVEKIPLYYNLYDIPKSDVNTADKKSMIADCYVIWKVTDPKSYYQTLGGVRGRAEERIEANVYNAVKNTISSMTQEEIIDARGDVLSNKITEASNSDVTQYGVEVVVSEIKVLDLPDNNKESVYARMISERKNIEAKYTAEGEKEAKKIDNETLKEVTITKANAEAEAAKLKAEGEAEYMRILSEAYNDPEKAEFYNFIRGLDSLKSLAGKNKTIILDKDSEFAKLLYGLQ